MTTLVVRKVRVQVAVLVVVTLRVMVVVGRRGQQPSQGHSGVVIICAVMLQMSRTRQIQSFLMHYYTTGPSCLFIAQ